MEVSRTQRISDSESGRERREDDLHLDRVVASQPEIGPTPPDGSYGWLIVVSAMIYNITVPGLLVMYGVIILKSVKNNDYEEGIPMKIWDVDIALVPVMMVVIRLLLESWCHTVVKVFNMPRFMALAGLCLTVAGVLLSSYSTDTDSNDIIVNIFAGLFTGSGCALTGQQTEVIITHYFRDKLTIAQRLVKMAPSIGNCLVPLLIGFLCSTYKNDVVVMIFAAILMQNCLFLASYTRPIYIERVIRSTYRMLRDAVDDEDEVIFSNQNARNKTEDPTINQEIDNRSGPSANDNSNVLDDGDDHIVVFNSKHNAKEILDPSVQLRDKTNKNINRFSSDFSTMHNNEVTNENRFSSDFGNLDIHRTHQNRNLYQELEDIENIVAPLPLYRETTVDAPSQNSLSLTFNPIMTEGSARRTATIKKNLYAIGNMFKDIDFYLYTLLHLSTTFSMLVFGVIFPPLLWEQNPNLNIWRVCALLSVTHTAAFCFVLLCAILPKSNYEKFRLCAIFCLVGAMGFYGITWATSISFLSVWALFASFSIAACVIVQQPLYNNILNEFDTTATITTANSIVAIFIMIWCISFNYQYKTCFFTASILQAFTCLVFIASSFRKRR